jgi:HTH-type transcriptional regulator / antitoxin HipB
MHARHTSAYLAEEIGTLVARERDRLGLTQDELAFTAGVSTRVIHQIEHGKETSRLDTVTAVLGALGLALAIAPSERRGKADTA